VLARLKLEMRCVGGRRISSQALLGLTLSGETSADRADRHWTTGLPGGYGSIVWNIGDDAVKEQAYENDSTHL
jgi:hypothetical protein